MELSIFPPPFVAILALFSGMIFGFLLRKATASRFDTIISQLLLQNFTVMKVIFTAIIVGGFGIYFLNLFDAISVTHLSKTNLLFSILGGSIFGVGMSVTGYCPGTAIAAIGEGSKDVIFTFIGMLIGAVIYNAFSTNLAPYIKEQDSFYQETIASYLDYPHLTVLTGLAIGWIALSYFLKRYEQNDAGL